MSLTVHPVQITDITNKFELAQRLTSDSKAPEEALQASFSGVMEQLEVIAHTKFDSSMKERVWNAVSEEKLKTLKTEFIYTVCERILGSFNEEDSRLMLEEHKNTGCIKNIRYTSGLQVAFHLSQSTIIDAVMQKATSMTKEWIPEIVEAVKKEGIALPEPKKS